MSSTVPCPDPPATPAAPPAPPPSACADARHAPEDIASQRNRFFTGKYMTERDFQDEQWYFLSRAWLHQRALHGWGIVCGLEVEPHRPDCAQDGWVIVYPGIAIDCYGRTVVVREPTAVRLGDLTPPPDADGTAGTDKPPPQSRILLGVRYDEKPTEPVPLLYDEDGCGRRTACNRVEEVATFCWADPEKMKDCWQERRPHTPCVPCPPPGPCLTPSCPCGGMVPLALVDLTGNDSKAPWKVADGNLTFRGLRFVPGPLAPDTLTHVCHINWSHAAETWRGDLEKVPGQLPERDTAPAPGEGDEGQGARSQEQAAQQAAPADADAARAPAAPAGEPDAEDKDEDEDDDYEQYRHHRPLYISVQLDRRLDAVQGATDSAVGLNGHTFFVQYAVEVHGRRRELFAHPHYAEEQAPPGSRCHPSRATLVLRPRHSPSVRRMLHRLEREGRLYVYVTLKCDLVPDRRGRAVDGNFLCGALRSGDGIEGGTFESWFTLTWDKTGGTKA